MVRKIFAALIAVIMFTSTAYAGVVYLNGIPIGKDIDAVEKDGTVYLPIRKLADMMGAKIEWDGKTKTVTIYNPLTIESNILAKVTIGEKTAVVYPVDDSGKPLGTSVFAEMEAAPIIIDSRTYIPFDFILENLGYEGDYDKDTGNINLKGSTLKTGR